jgi:predicted dehydrogenase
MSHKPENQGTTRRDFIRNAAAAAAVTAATAETAKSSVYSLAPARVLGANDRIRIAHVGLGVQGWGAHVRLLKQQAAANNTEQVAVCDLYGRRNRRAGETIGLSEANWYKNHKKMLERKDIDAVVIATSDNWHAPVALDSLAAGKHVYCEKPMCKTLEETFAMYDAVKKSGRKFQLGSQGCSDPMYKGLQEIVKSGKLGKVIMGQHSYNRGDNKTGEWNSYGDNPFKAWKEGDPANGYRNNDHRSAGPNAKGEDHIDWDTYRKGTQPAAWDPDRFFRFRKYWEYGSGLVGDLMPHRLNPMMIAMNLPLVGNQGWPTRVSSGGGLYVQKVNPDTGKLDRTVPDFTYITVDFPDQSLIVMSTSINEQGMRPMIRGNKATLFFSGDRAEIKPERAYSDEVEGEQIRLNSNGEPIEIHQKNWLDCIRNGGEPNGNIDLATRVQTMISLGELAYRYNQTFTFDPSSRKASPDPSKFEGAAAAAPVRVPVKKTTIGKKATR